MANSAAQYQDSFLKILKSELVRRKIEVNAIELEKRLRKIEFSEQIIEKRESDLKRLPPSILWASNFVYLSAVLSFLSFIYAVAYGYIIETNFISLISMINVGVIIFIAWVIKKGRDIRKLLIYVVVTSGLGFLGIALLTFRYDETTRFGLSLMNFIFPTISLILLYTEDSKDWYENEGVIM